MPRDQWLEKDLIIPMLERRRTEFEGILNVLHAIDGGLEAKIAQKLLEGRDDNLPNYALLDKNSGRYDETKAEEVKNLVREHYSITNPLSPLRRGVKVSELPELIALDIESRYFGHKDALVAAVGTSNFSGRMRSIQDNHRSRVAETILQSTMNGYNESMHADPVVKALMSQYGVDSTKVDVAKLKSTIPDLIGAYMQRKLDKDIFYNIAPLYTTPR